MLSSLSDASPSGSLSWGWDTESALQRVFLPERGQEVDGILKCMDCEHFKNAQGVGQKVCPMTGQKKWRGDPAEGCTKAKFKVRKEEVITC